MNHSWVSQKSGGLYHLEDEERFDVHGGKFTAFCGATGLFRSVRIDDGLLPFEKCAECLEWKENFQIADLLEGNTPIHQLGNEQVGDEGVAGFRRHSDGISYGHESVVNRPQEIGISDSQSLAVHPSGLEVADFRGSLPPSFLEKIGDAVERKMQ